MEVDALYNPTVSANIISSSLVLTFLVDKPLEPTDRTFWSSSGDLVEEHGFLQSVSIGHRDVEDTRDFHVFEVQDFDILIGHPIENFLLDAPILGKLDV
uniref:Uncharacterized protein n=1 Tax=Setaria italica TaxID=4555 RepID=K4AL07_SETIT